MAKKGMKVMKKAGMKKAGMKKAAPGMLVRIVAPMKAILAKAKKIPKDYCSPKMLKIPHHLDWVPCPTKPCFCEEYDPAVLGKKQYMAPGVPARHYAQLAKISAIKQAKGQDNAKKESAHAQAK